MTNKLIPGWVWYILVLPGLFTIIGFIGWYHWPRYEAKLPARWQARPSKYLGQKPVLDPHTEITIIYHNWPWKQNKVYRYEFEGNLNKQQYERKADSIIKSLKNPLQ